MPDILKFNCERWEFNLWTRNNSDPRELLRAILKEREKELPSEQICFSFQLTGNESVLFEEKSLAITENTASIDIPAPLCYENRDYEFEFQFKNGYLPDEENPVIHRLNEIESGFRTIGHNSVRGIVNFKNNIGWFKLGLRFNKEGKTYRDTFSFKVYPTKMDMESDLDIISKTIDEIYPLWRFTLTQKTDFTLSRSKRRHESFELLWIAQFRELAGNLAYAGKLICRSPHSRLLPEIKRIKAERISGKITGRLEERIKEDLSEKRYDKRYRIEKKKLSYDTPENRFVKMVLNYSVKRMNQFYDRVKDLEQIPENSRLSDSFYRELSELASPFEKLTSEPLFHEIGNYDGRMRESLVLHQRAGYANVYHIWQELKLYLDYFGSDVSVSVRSVEQLYEIWCLLEIRRLLITLGFKEGRKSVRTLRTVGFEKSLKKEDETFYLYRPDGMEVKLIHEPSYSGNNKKFNKIYSWTTTQRPDILLEVKLPSGENVRWVFDAKYRIDTNENKDWPQKGIDTVPDDAINQMHRYRDSLIYISQADKDGETDKYRPIIGAFALYPGWFENQSVDENPYMDSIESVSIGAFPLLPGQESNWLAGFLKSQLGVYNQAQYEIKEPDELYLQESMRIPVYGMKQIRHSELILAADVYGSNKSTAYIQSFKEGSAQWYHIPESTTQNYKISRFVMREIKYCAFTSKFENGRQCKFIYPVEKVVLKSRKEIDEYAGGKSSRGGDRMYWLIKLGKSFQSPITLLSEETHRQFRFRLLEFRDFLTAKSWDDIPRKYKSHT